MVPAFKEPKAYSEEPRQVNRHEARMSKWEILHVSSKESCKATAEGEEAPKESVPLTKWGVCAWSFP